MSLTASAIRLLAERGLSIEDIAAIAEANEARQDAAPVSKAAERTRRWREKKASQSVTCDVTASRAETVTGDVTDRHKPSPGDAPRAHVRDITSNSENNHSLSLVRVRECAGDALASMATHPGIASLHPLTGLLKADPPCTADDVYGAIEAAAAWHRGNGGPGSMRSWKVASRIALENRDNRLAGHPVNDPTHHRQARPTSDVRRAATDNRRGGWVDAIAEWNGEDAGGDRDGFGCDPADGNRAGHLRLAHARET